MELHLAASTKREFVFCCGCCWAMHAGKKEYETTHGERKVRGWRFWGLEFLKVRQGRDGIKWLRLDKQAASQRFTLFAA